MLWAVMDKYPRHPAWGDFVDALVDDPPRARAMLAQDPSLLESRGLWGETPLHFLAVEKFTDAVELALALGANPDPRNDFDETPLLSCVTICKPEHDLVAIIRALLARGADPYHSAKSQSCSWHLARRSKDPRVKLLFAEFPPPGRVHAHCELEDSIWHMRE